MSPQVPGDPTALTWTVDQLLGGRTLEDVLGHEAPGPLTLTTAPYHYGSPATGGLVQVQGDGWAAFVKVLHHLRHWPLITQIPPWVAEDMMRDFPWRVEVDMWSPAWVERLPDGLRVPHLYDVVELGDDRIAVWMEQVQALPDSAWGLPELERAARLLGVFNARMAEQEVVDACPLPADFAMDKWANVGLIQGLGPLEDDGLWAHPWLSDAGDVRAGLRAAVEDVQRVLGLLRVIPHGMPHGDASPQNLLRTDDGQFVMIDISFQAPAPLGTDLAQLVVGLAHAGYVTADELPEIERTVLRSYAAGLKEAGYEVNDDDLATSYAGTLLLRSGFTSLPYDWLADPAQQDAFAGRVELTRFVLDSADRLL